MMQKGIWLSLLSALICSLLSFPASAQTRIANLVLTNGKVMQNVEIIQEDDKRIQFRKGDVKAWLSREEIKSIEIVGEASSWKEPTPSAGWLALWTPEKRDISNVQTVTEEGQKWNRISTKYFDLHFKDTANREEVLKLARTQDNVYRLLYERTGRDIPYPIKAYLMPERIGAHCDFETMSIYMTETGNLDSFISWYMHEVTHLFNKGKMQNWWSGEFMCIYDQERSIHHEAGIWEFFKNAAETDTTPWNQVDDNMDRSKLPGEKWDNRLFKAAAIYYFIEETYGVKKLAEFWDRNCEPRVDKDIGPVFEAVFDKSMEELQEEYQRFYRIEGITPATAKRPITRQVLPKVTHGREAIESYNDNPAPFESKQAVAVDYSPIIKQYGVNFDGITVGDPRCTKQFIRSKLGKPEQENEHWLSYNTKYGLDLCMADDVDLLIEIRLNRGFKGKLDSGISLSSAIENVFRIYGKPLGEEAVYTSRIPEFENRVFYRRGANGAIAYLYKGLLFWFEADKINQIVIFRKKEGTPPPDEVEPIAVPLIRTSLLWNYVEKLWIYWYFTIPVLVILAFLLSLLTQRLHDYWRPLPEGRLLLVWNPTKEELRNINVWYEARRLKKRRLLIGSDEKADIRLMHPSVSQQHAWISARRTESGVVTCVERIGDAEVSVNDNKNAIMPLAANARVEIGRFRFKYEMPSEYRQVRALYKSGKVVEGVPTSWDVDKAGFTLIPSKAPSWTHARFIRFGKLKGVYFVCDWDEDVRKNLLNQTRISGKRLMTIHFADGEIMPGHSIGDYKEENPRFYFFPDDQSGDTVYILIERSSVKSVIQGERSA